MVVKTAHSFRLVTRMHAVPPTTARVRALQASMLATCTHTHAAQRSASQ